MLLTLGLVTCPLDNLNIDETTRELIALHCLPTIPSHVLRRTNKFSHYSLGKNHRVGEFIVALKTMEYDPRSST